MIVKLIKYDCCYTQLEKREKWINKKSGQPSGVIHRGSQTKQKGWRRDEVVEPRKRLLGRQARGRAMAQGQGGLVRAVRRAPAVRGAEKWGGGGWVRQQQRATAARPLGIAAVRLRIRLARPQANGGRLGAAASGVLRRPRRRGGHGLVRGGLPRDPAWARDGERGGGRGCGGLGRVCQ